MTWIRGPWWDSFWILSGLPVGLALMFMPPAGLLLFFTLVVLLDTGHSFSPIVLAWSHHGFRQLMFGRIGQYVVLPSAVFVASLAVGVLTSLGWTSYIPGRGQIWRLTDWTNPLPAAAWIYWIWNIYHFSMQNFGVVQLYRRNSPHIRRQRLIDKSACLAITAVGMVAVPGIMHSSKVGLLCLGVFSFNHWMVSIGLCSAVSRHNLAFIAGVMVLGGIGFVWTIPTSAGNMIRVVPVIICARMGLGLVHFLYDRWLWKLSDPQVRATIGKELFV